MAEPRSALGRLVASLVVDSAEFTAGLTKSEAELAKFQRGVDAKLAAVERRFSGMAKAFGAGLAAAFSVDAIKQKIGGAIDALDEVNKFSERTGLATEEVQKFGYIAKLQETNIEAFSTGLKKLSISIADAIANASGEKARAFEALGVQLKDANGKARSSTDVFGDLANVFKNASAGPERMALAVKLLGKAADELMPTLTLGKQGIADMGKEAEQFGLVTGPEAVKMAAEFKDNLDRIDAAGRGAAQALAASILQTLVEITSRFVEAVKAGGTFRAMLAEISQLGVKQSGALANDVFGLFGAKGPADNSPEARAKVLEQEISTLQDLINEKQDLGAFGGDNSFISNLMGFSPARRAERLKELQTELASVQAEVNQQQKEFYSKVYNDPGRQSRLDAITKAQKDAADAKIRSALEKDQTEVKNQALEFYARMLKQINIEEEVNLGILRGQQKLEPEQLEALKRRKDVEEQIAKLRREGKPVDTNLFNNLLKTIDRGENTAKLARLKTEGIELSRKYQEEQAREIDLDFERSRPLVQQTRELEQQLAIIGKTPAEVEKLTRAWAESEIAHKQNNAEIKKNQGESIFTLTAEIELLQKKAELQQKQLADAKDSLFNPVRGAREALTAYLDHVAEAGARTKEAISGSLGALQSTLEEFFTTGKFGFKEFITSIQREFARLASQQLIRQIIGLAAGFASNNTAFAFPSSTTGFRMHTGGVVGAGDGQSMPVNAAMFHRAPRFHGGLMPNEFPAILQKGEGVFTQAQMKALGGRSVQVNQTNNFSTGVPASQMAAFARQVVASAQAAVSDATYRRIGMAAS